MRAFTLVLMLMSTIMMVSQMSCVHSPVVMDDDDMMPADTMMIDTMPSDTMTAVPCDPNVVYFDQEILPILVSNCAFSGCHDEASAEDGVILVSYESVIETADIEPFNIDDTELYEVLVHSDEMERMPPAPTPPLDAEQINLVAKWILQGAEDLHCDPDADGCDTEGVSFSEDLQPVIANHCVGCHSGSAPSGGIDLSAYPGVKAVADNGQLLGAVRWEAGFQNMPQGGAQLNDCIIDQIAAWIADGALDN